MSFYPVPGRALILLYLHADDLVSWIRRHNTERQLKMKMMRYCEDAGMDVTLPIAAFPRPGFYTLYMGSGMPREP